MHLQREKVDGGNLLNYAVEESIQGLCIHGIWTADPNFEQLCQKIKGNWQKT